MFLQLVMLKELGYTTVLVCSFFIKFFEIKLLLFFFLKISQSDLSEQSVMKRVDLIKKKLLKASQNTEEIFIE